VIAAVVTGLLAAMVAGAAGWLLGRRVAASRATGLERRLALLEDEAGRKYRERLAGLKRRLGFVYLDGLPAAADRDVADMFEAGTRYASQAEWDKAGERWSKARARAGPAEAAALRFLCGVCRLFLSQPGEARAEFEAALDASREARDQAGTAASLLALGAVAAEQGESRESGRRIEEALRLSRGLGLGELQAAALVRLAGLADAQEDFDRALVFHRQAVQALQAAGDRVAAVRQYGAAGETLVRKGELDKARAAHEDGLLLARQVKDRAGEAERLASIGLIHRAQGDAARALEVIERAFHSYEEIHQNGPMARLLYELSLIHEERGEPDAAQEYRERSLALARKTGERWLQARNLEQMAEHCLSQGALEQGLALFEEAAAIDREDKRKRDLCHDLTGLGRALFRLSRGDEATRPLAEALALSEELSDQRAEMWVSLFLGEAQGVSGLADDALRSLERTQVLARKAGEDGVQAAALAEAALVYSRQQDWSAAAASAQAAFELHRKLGDRLAQARDLVELGVAFGRLSRLDDARARLEDGLRLAHEEDDPEMEARALFELAAVNTSWGDAARARENLQRSLQLREAEGDMRGQADCLLALGRLLAAAGAKDEARSRLDQAARLYVRLDDRERAADATRAMAGLPGSGGVQIIG